MRNYLVVAAVLLCASPALAGERTVSKSKLNSLGLGQMTAMSDAQGMQVRGRSSNGESGSLSLFSLFLFDPNTASNFSSTGSGFGRGTAENGGLAIVSSTNAASQTQFTGITASINLNGISVFSATVTAFGIQGFGSTSAF